LTEFRKILKFHENPSSGSRDIPRGQTDITELTVAFRNFSNAPKNAKISALFQQNKLEMTPLE